MIYGLFFFYFGQVKAQTAPAETELLPEPRYFKSA